MGKQVKVILTADVKNLGQFGDEKHVKLGYASNFLVPNHLAQRVSAHNTALVKQIRNQKDAYIKQKHDQALILKQKLDNQAIQLSVAVNDNNDLYGAISRSVIVDAIKNQLQLDIDRNYLDKSVSLDALGDHPVTMTLFDGITATVIARIIKES